MCARSKLQDGFFYSFVNRTRHRFLHIATLVYPEIFTPLSFTEARHKEIIAVLYVNMFSQNCTVLAKILNYFN